MPRSQHKPLMAEEMAHDFRLPIIRVIEGSGGGGSVKTIETKGAANLPGGVGGTALVLVHDRQHGAGAGGRRSGSARSPASARRGSPPAIIR